MPTGSSGRGGSVHAPCGPRSPTPCRPSGRPSGAEHLPSELLVVDRDDHLLDAEPVGEHRERVADGSQRGRCVGQIGDQPVGRVEEEWRGRFTGR